jgi:TetR/AcrR family transcriptional regulator, transcriptional repressor of bet genes
MPKLGMRPIRRAQIFRAATEVIARESFSGTTLKKVADAAGVSTGTVNHYFSNKRAMLIETLIHIAGEWNDSTRQAVYGAEPGVARLKSLVEAAGPRSSINKLRWKVWMAAWGEALQSPELRATLRRSRQEWTSILADALDLINKDLGGPEIDTREIARLYDALQNGLFVALVTSDSPGEDRRITDLLFAFLMDRVGPQAHVPITPDGAAPARTPI